MSDVREFDAAYHLDNPEVIAAFIEDAIETGDEVYIRHAIGVVARARGMDEMARKLGMSRSGLYKALSPKGNPSFTTMLRLLASIDVKLQPVPAT
jgi:probable addiction module antidote protein